jgi:hypothetical protein
VTAKSGIGTGPYLIAVGVVVVVVGVLVTAVGRDVTLTRASGAYAALFGLLWAAGIASLVIAPGG